MDKDKCYSCKFRGNVSGSVHSSCQHPNLDGVSNDPTAIMMAMLASVGRASPQIDVQAISDKFEIKANYNGIKNGWFNWPWDFDPVWLENCNAHEENDLPK